MKEKDNLQFKRDSLDKAFEQADKILNPNNLSRVKLDAILSEIEFNKLESQFLGSFSREIDLDTIDIIATGLIGAIGAAIDLLIVAIPSDVTYLGAYPQKGSILTKFFKNWTCDSENSLAKISRVPFDVVSGTGNNIEGMSPGNHRFMTPGHDSLLGFVVGVYDIMMGGRTAIDKYGALSHTDGFAEPEGNFIVAFTVELLHLLSDVATKAGLPAPLATVAGLFQFGSFGEHNRTVAELARYMYLHGYDLRHFLTTCSSPAVIRMMVATYFLGRRWLDKEYEGRTDVISRRKGSILSNKYVKTITFMADAIACAANAGKIALYYGNPSAFNYAQWLGFAKSSLSILADKLESPTEILLDRAYANEMILKKRFVQIRKALELPGIPDPFEAF